MVTLRDFGISGIDLTYALIDPYELVILVDALYAEESLERFILIEPQLAEGGVTATFRSPQHESDERAAHGPSLWAGARGKILLVGCEPADLGPEEGKLGLSDPVEAAIGEAVGMIEKLVAENAGVSQSR